MTESSERMTAPTTGNSLRDFLTNASIEELLDALFPEGPYPGPGLSKEEELQMFPWLQGGECHKNGHLYLQPSAIRKVCARCGLGL